MCHELETEEKETTTTRETAAIAAAAENKMHVRLPTKPKTWYRRSTQARHNYISSDLVSPSPFVFGHRFHKYSL